MSCDVKPVAAPTSSSWFWCCLGLICLVGAVLRAIHLGSIGFTPLILGLAVALWVAGFDIIYACQDVEFDRKEPLFSIPKRFGIRGALWISGILHCIMLGILAYLFVREGMGIVGFTGLALVGLLLAYEHSLVKPGDLSRANAAFFTINGFVSILLCVTTAIDILWDGLN